MKLSRVLIAFAVVVSTNVLAAPPDTVPAPAKDVNVVNIPTVNANVTGTVNADITGPVDVSGSTVDANITNIPTVDAQQIGSWQVDVINTPGVTIENDSASPVPVTTETAIREPFLFSDNISFTESTNQLVYDVPVGKRLVIETISASPTFATHP